MARRISYTKQKRKKWNAGGRPERARDAINRPFMCVFRARQVQLMGNWTHKSSRPAVERHRITYGRQPAANLLLQFSLPFLFFFYFSISTGRVKNLILP